ncbi:MAG TPA: integration host factor subunit alpha [Proteobacteria bacterium]|nr:integration host factor subunit alpha [Deltaproteobacteria bacterium]HDS16291.1 integration host factor subunit alpha [Pseudomonadota bacterium]
MTKADMVEVVYERIGVSKREAARIVENLFDILKETLEQGENVKISGFGSFNIQHKKPRRGRNPQTGEEITISARRVLSFKASNVLRDQLNP